MNNLIYPTANVAFQAMSLLKFVFKMDQIERDYLEGFCFALKIITKKILTAPIKLL